MAHLKVADPTFIIPNDQNEIVSSVIATAVDPEPAWDALLT